MPRVFRAGAQRVGKVLATRPPFRERGYDAAWDRLSLAFRRKHPFCRFCLQEGVRETFADVVDHVVPVADRPDLVHAADNLQSLCHGHHKGLKARLEAFARTTGQMEMLARWCADPAARPRFRGEIVGRST